MHFWRGFFIYAAVSIAPTLVLGFLSATVGEIAMLFAYVLAPALVYAYPLLLLMPSGDAALWISLLLAIMGCAVFGLLTRRLAAGAQWLLAVTAFAGWWIAWRLICLAANIHPHFDVRM